MGEYVQVQHCRILMQTSDEQIFESLVKKYRGQLTGAAYHLSGSRDAAMDIVQETLVDAYRGFSGLRDREKALPWLYAILRRKVLADRRRHRVVVELSEDIASDKSFDTGDIVREIVAEQMAALSWDDREILAGKYLLGLSYRELSESLGISESNVGVRCFRAMERLRTALSEAGVSLPQNRK